MDFSTKTAKGVFWGGTLSSLALFLVLTVDTQRQIGALTHADKLDEQVVAGKRVFQKYNCNNCHTMLGFGGYYAPDMTRVYGRIGADGIRNAVLHPEKTFAGSNRKMPAQGVSPEEAEQLVAFFRWTHEIDNNGWPPQDEQHRKTKAGGLVVSTGLTPGAALVQTSGCLNCHAVQGVGGKSGPSFDHIGAQKTAEEIAKYIQNPAAVNPNAQMPGQDLSPEALNQVAEFLARQR